MTRWTDYLWITPAPGRGPAQCQEDDDLSQTRPATDLAKPRGLPVTDVTRGATPDADTASDAHHTDALLDAILTSLDDDKAEDIVQIDLRGRSEMGDWMVIASGRSTRQVAAIAEKLTDRVKQAFGVVSKVEGKETGDWVLIDTGDVIVHVFRPEVREFYQLEKMWSPRQPAAATR